MISVQIPGRMDYNPPPKESRISNKLKGYYSCDGLSYAQQQSVPRHFQVSMGGNKKRRMSNPFWRPITTQATSNEESLVEDAMVDSENSPSAHVASVVAEAEEGFAGAVFTSITVQNSVELKDAEELGDAATMSIVQSSSVDADTKEISLSSTEKHAVSLEVGASLMRFIRGKGGSTQKDIEEEMGVKIIFPSSKKEDSIVIEGDSAESISRASEKIQLIIEEVVKCPNLDYSHFVSLPLAIYPELVDKLARFQKAILGDGEFDETVDDDSSEGATEDEDRVSSFQNASDVAVKLEVEGNSERVKVDITNIPLTSYPPKKSKSSTLSDLGIDRSIFIKPKTFHLTVLMLKLWSKQRVQAAMDVLQNVLPEVIDALENQSVFVRLKGLDCMRGSLAKARVLYAPVEEIGNEDRLSRACQIIIDAYVRAGLVLEKDARQKMKLHATVMNARHRKRKTRTRKNDSFDARGICKQFGNEEWGEYHIREAHLSQRFAYDDTGYYHCCASITFP